MYEEKINRTETIEVSFSSVVGISGSIFASPPSSEIFRLIIEMKRRGAKQVLLIILNYTGDRLNFGLAMERARESGIDIDMLVVADDAAVDSAIG